MWKEYSKRAMIVLGGVGAFWFVGHLVGRYLIVYVDGLDRVISSAVNPDAYFPGLDEFFRAVSDYSNLLIVLPMLSLAVAIGLFNLSQMDFARAFRRSAITCLILWAVIALVPLLEDVSWKLLLPIGLLPVMLIVLGAGPAFIFSNFDARKWLLGLLFVEVLICLGLWVTHKIWWNPGLPGANYIFLAGLLCAFAVVIREFHRMDDAGMKRYIGVFWLVLLSSLLVQIGPTQNLKKNIARPRPLNDVYTPWNETLRVIPEERLTGNNSFPSGHVSGTVTLITPFFWWARTRRVKAGFLAWGFMQGASRVYTVAHFTSDCVIGATLGFGIGTLVFFVLGGPGLRELERAGEN